MGSPKVQMVLNGCGRRLVSLILAAGALALLACSGDDDGAALVGRQFLSRAVSENGVARPLVAGTRIRIGFPSRTEISAHAGCNSMFGEIRFSAEGRISVSTLSSTLIGCETELDAQDQWLRSFLTSKPRWVLQGDVLTLSNDALVIELVDRVIADPDRPFEGTLWAVDTIFKGEAAQSAPPGATLTFTGGQVNGSSGCNTIAGTYAVAGDKLNLGSQVASTKVACGPPLDALEVAVLNLFGKSLTVSITARRLTLVDANGVGLGFQAPP